MPLFDHITIVGLGLIGGSLGMAIRRRGLARTVIGLSRNSSTLRRAKQLGAIDVGTTDAKRAVEQADLVVLATPVDTIVPYAKRLSAYLRTGSVLTDVGSTKGEIVRAVERQLPKSVTFVGAHPLAGSEQRGVEASRQDLFDDSICIITSSSRTSSRALRTVMSLWTPLVRRVIVMTPHRHDALLASVSHLPHLLAFSLIEATPPEALAVAPRSFLDMTRVAKSEPELWDDIFLGNRNELLAALTRFDRHLRRLRTALTQADRATLRQILARVSAKRRHLQDDGP